MNKDAFRQWLKSNGYSIVYISKMMAIELNDERYYNPDRMRNIIYNKVQINKREERALIKLGVDDCIFQKD